MNPGNLTNFEKVVQFMELAGQYIGDEPSEPDSQTIRLRCNLIAEEYLEVRGVLVSGGPIQQIAKELADLLYVVYGAAAAYGINMDAIFHEVHISNLTKFPPNEPPQYTREGKLLKSSAYVAPDIKGVLEEQIWPLDVWGDAADPSDPEWWE